MGVLSGAPASEVVRLEAVAETVACSGIDAHRFPSAYRDALDDCARDAVGLKTVVAYRGGFGFDPEPPGDAEMVRAAGPFLARAASRPPPPGGCCAPARWSTPPLIWSWRPVPV
jgi:uncharacterized protein